MHPPPDCYPRCCALIYLQPCPSATQSRRPSDSRKQNHLTSLRQDSRGPIQTQRPNRVTVKYHQLDSKLLVWDPLGNPPLLSSRILLVPMGRNLTMVILLTQRICLGVCMPAYIECAALRARRPPIQFCSHWSKTSYSSKAWLTSRETPLSSQGGGCLDLRCDYDC